MFIEIENFNNDDQSNNHQSIIQSINLNTDNKTILSCSIDMTIKLWDIENLSHIKTITGHKDYIYSVYFIPNSNMIITNSEDKTIKIWHLLTGRCIYTLKLKETPLPLKISNNGNYFVFSEYYKGNIHLWDLINKKEISILNTSSNSTIKAFSFSKDDDLLLSGGCDKIIRLWDIKTGKLVKTFNGHTKTIETLEFSPCNNFFISSGCDKIIKLWDIKTGKIVKTFNEHTGNIYSLLFTNNNEIISSDSNGNIFQWDIKTKQIKKHIKTFDNIYSIQITKDNKTLFVAGGIKNNKIEKFNLEPN